MALKTGFFTGNPKKTETGDDVFRMVFDRIQTGILIIDSVTHTIIDANPIAEELIGRPKDQIVGNTCHNFVCPVKCGECPVTDMHKDIHNIEGVLINAKGEKVPILKTVAKAEVNGKEYLIESFIDIIDRKKAEERRVALIAYLNESLMRVEKPLALVKQNLQELATRVTSGEYDSEDIRMQLQIDANNLGQIAKNIGDLSRQAVEERDDIPSAFKEFVIGK
ncbi:MAG: PAS domain-containing protein [Methanoregula sp.]